MIKNRAGQIAKKKGLNILAFAEKAGVSYKTAYDVYKDRANRISYDVLDKICEALEVQPGDILVRVANIETTENNEEEIEQTE